MRLFVALNFPEDLRAALHAAAAPLRAAVPAARWTAVEKLHLTMKFLGERPPELVPSLASALDAVAAPSAVLEVVFEGIGAFPNFRRPRVVWAGMIASAALVALERGVDDACAALGVERENRPFHPHVTLARIGPRVPRAQVQALAHEHHRVALHGATVVHTLDLMQSVGGRYVPLHRAPLAA